MAAEQTSTVWLSAAEAARRVAAGEVTPSALVEDALARVAALDGDVRAWQLLDADGARAAAVDPGLPDGPLRGVPVGVKDLIDTAGLTTTYGSELYAANVPARDAGVVARLRAAGGIVLGKTVTTEFAAFRPGPTRNPHDLEHTPGGSSSGSAAAVAAGMVPLAIGTQTAGSVIRPAAFCGVVGYKPTLGWVSRAGVLAFSDSLDQMGVFARSIDDAALFAGVLAGRDLRPREAGAAPQPTFALSRPSGWADFDPAVRDLLERVADELVTAGARVTELDAVDDDEAALQAQIVVMLYEGVRELAHEWTSARDGLSEPLQALLERGAALTAADYDAALDVMTAARAQASGRLADVDALLTLSAPGPAPRGLDTTGDPICNRVWTLLGTPCLHLPVDRAPNGLPIGVQLVGAPRADRRMLEAATWASRALGVTHLVPPMP